MLYFNKKSLNVNSLVSESQERVDNIKLSVEKAKEAVSLDVTDGVSWCKYSTLTVITLDPADALKSQGHFHSSSTED